MGMLIHEDLSEQIIGAAIEVHKMLGPGFLESVYEECLGIEFELRGLAFRRQIEVPLTYKNRPLQLTHRLDLLVEDTAVVELKSVEKVLLVHEFQLFSYMRATRKKLGLLLNFNVPYMKDGIVRRVL